MKKITFIAFTIVLLIVFALSLTATAQTAADADALLAKAVELGEKNDFAGAEKAARQAIKVNPQFFAGYVVLGAALAELERYEEAVEAVTKGLELMPKDADGRADIESTLTELKAESVKSSNASQTNKTETVSRENTGNSKGRRVNVRSYSILNEATILEESGGKYKVHYEDAMHDDEWVAADRIVPFEFGDTAGGPPSGKYICYMPMYENTYMGTFVVSASGNYQYQTGNKGSGKFKYDAATNAIEWVSGDLAGKGVTGEYFNLKDNDPTILLIFPKGKRQGDIQRCLKKD